jgi:hypothetical protein
MWVPRLCNLSAIAPADFRQFSVEIRWRTDRQESEEVGEGIFL